MQSSKDISVALYDQLRRDEWNSLVDSAFATHFFFRREYMEYHADRFADFSLVVSEGRKLIAVLPANRVGNIVYSHQGLTYGGLIVADKARSAVSFLSTLDLVRDFLRSAGITSLVYKPLPQVFRTTPGEEDLYALHRLGAKLIRRELSSVIALGGEPRYAHGKRDNIRKALRAGLAYERSDEFEAFHSILTHTLARHGVRPVHSVEELQLLSARFPSNIHLYSARNRGEVVAAVLVFENASVVHTQYMATSEQGREIGALDALIDHLIAKVYAHKRYLNFGISTVNDGRELNEGLVRSKEGFGASGLVHDWYELGLA